MTKVFRDQKSSQRSKEQLIILHFLHVFIYINTFVLGWGEWPLPPKLPYRMCAIFDYIYKKEILLSVDAWIKQILPLKRACTFASPFKIVTLCPFLLLCEMNAVIPGRANTGSKL